MQGSAIGLQGHVLDVSEILLFSPAGALSDLAGHECGSILAALPAQSLSAVQFKGNPAKLSPLRLLLQKDRLGQTLGADAPPDEQAQMKEWAAALGFVGVQEVGNVVEPPEISVEQLRAANGTGEGRGGRGGGRTTRRRPGR